jgi:tripartite-type tricarboxylate transporter receptor subunit TctC
MTICRLVVFAMLAVAPVPTALAQSFPAKPVRVIIPFPPGGGIDVVVRALGAELSAKWGQPVVIDNRAGAGGNIGTEAAARSTPDGYTLLAAVNQTFSANRYLYKSLGYDPDKSFAPVTLMVQNDQYFLAHPSVRARDLRELIADARREPGRFNYGSFGIGSQPHLAFSYINRKQGTDLLHVPYKGIAPLMTAIAGGEVMLATGTSGVAGELMKAGKLKGLAIAGRQRAALFPNVPTTAELGYPDLLVSIWFGLFAPAGTPAAVVEKIGDDARAILKSLAFIERHLAPRGYDVVAGSAAELAATIREESAAVAEMIKAAGVTPE